MSGGPERTSRVNSPDRAGRIEAALRAASALDETEHLAFVAALSACRPPSVVDRIFAPAPDLGAPVVVPPDGNAAPLAERKRLLVKVWEGLPEAERRAFLARVDPRGVFIRGAS